jgi:outer membrane receptor for ferric coprogen and ferric-rhodotorulic acid
MLLSLSAPTLLFTAIASAQNAGNSKIEVVEVYGTIIEQYLADEMNTATRLPLSSVETPQSVSAITRAQLNDFRLWDLDASLQTATGIQVESVETDRTYYTSRGFDITNFQVDGVGIPLTYGNMEGDIDTAMYDRIEIVRGANGLMSGAGNPSATVNMIRKRPNGDNALTVTGSAGSYNLRRLEADGQYALNDTVAARVVVANEQAESHLDRYARDKNLVYGVVRAEVTDATILTVGASWQESNADSPMWGALPMFFSDGTQTNYARSASTSADWAYWDTTETQGFAELKVHLNDNWQAQVYASYTDIQGDSQLFYMYSNPDPITHEGLVGYASDYVLDDSRALVDAWVSGKVTAFGREHDVVIGVNWTEVDVTDVSLYDFTTGNGFPAIGDFREWDGVATFPTLVDGRNGSDWTDEQLAFYAATRINLTDRLSFIGGARVIDWDSDGESYGESQDTTASGKVLPYAGTVYTLTDSTSLYASYTETFMPQRDLSATGARLAPAEGTNTEIGAKGLFFDDKLLVTAALFETEHQNVSEFAYFDAELGQNVYAGQDYESDGWEIEVSGQLYQGLQAVIGYTHMDITDAQTGEESRTFVPKRMLRANLSWRPAFFTDLKLGVAARWQDDIQRENFAGGVIRQDAYALYDAFATYKVTEQLDVSVNVYNLSNEKYIQSLYWDQAFYGAPTTGVVSVQYSL